MAAKTRLDNQSDGQVRVHVCGSAVAVAGETVVVGSRVSPGEHAEESQVVAGELGFALLSVGSYLTGFPDLGES